MLLRATAVSISVAILAGCATPIPAEQASAYDVCRYTMAGGNDSIVAERERVRRGLDCTPYYAAINAREARLASDNQAVMNYLQATQRPAPAPAQRPLQCYSYQRGSNIYTDCR